MAEYAISPTVLWKIGKVSSYCKKICPAFKFRDATWKLKFICYKNAHGVDACRIDLKTSGNKSNCKDILVESYCLRYGDKYFPTSVSFIYSELKRMSVWEETWEAISCDFTSMLNFWERAIFVCSIILTEFTPTDLFPTANHSELEAGSSSHCVTSLCHDFANLFNNHLMSDVILTCGDSKIYAHKAVLAARSEFFAAMIRTNMKKSKQEIIEIKDIEPSVLEQLVRYMYSGEILELSSDNVHQLYVAADKYRVEALKMKCGVFMVENPTVVKVSRPVKAPEQSEDRSLKEAIVSHFAAIKEVLCTKEWQKLSEKEPKFAQEAFLFFVSKSP